MSALSFRLRNGFLEVVTSRASPAYTRLEQVSHAFCQEDHGTKGRIAGLNPQLSGVDKAGPSDRL